jgi:hypothetical protein
MELNFQHHQYKMTGPAILFSITIFILSCTNKTKIQEVIKTENYSSRVEALGSKMMTC